MKLVSIAFPTHGHLGILEGGVGGDLAQMGSLDPTLTAWRRTFLGREL